MTRSAGAPVLMKRRYRGINSRGYTNENKGDSVLFFLPALDISLCDSGALEIYIYFVKCYFPFGAMRKELHSHCSVTQSIIATT